MKTFPLRSSKSTQKGYGIAFLLVFVISSILISGSFQFLSGPSTLNYVGENSQNGQSAYNVALYGLEQMQTAMQSQLNANTAITTSYTTNGTLTMPTDADQLIAGSTTVGSYNASVTNARGNAYTVSVTGTSGGASVTLTRLLIMSRAVPVLDLFSPTYAYSLRRLRSAYTGSAIRIRRPSDNTEQDIGFTPSGDLDIASVLSFVSYTQQPPVDQVSGAIAAYGLRKLRSAYAGSAIRVRRSSDDTEQDIGFDNDGNLDLDALFNFVSTSSGYVKTWYDQSGSSYDSTQTFTWAQPMIVNSGTLIKLYNGKPAIKFDAASNTWLLATRSVQDDFSIIACYSLVSADVAVDVDGFGYPSNLWWEPSMLVDGGASGVANDFGMSVGKDGTLYGGTGNPDSNNTAYITPLSNGTSTPDTSGNTAGYSGDGSVHWAMFTRTKATNALRVYLDDPSGANTGSYTGTNYSSLTASGQIAFGKMANDWAGFFTGYMTEVIIYPSVLSSGNRQALQKNQGGYFHMEEMPLAFVKTWYDQSGNGNNLTQTTNANQPALVLQTSQRPTIAFSGGSDQLQATSGLASGNGARTLNVVISPKFPISASDVGKGWFSVGYGTVGLSDQCFGISYTNLGLYTPYTWGVNGSAVTAQTLANDNSIVTVVRDGASTTVGYLNGTQVSTKTGAISTTATPGLTVGYRGDDRYNDGRASEIIGFNSNLSTANRQTLEEDQKSYYAIQQ